MRIAALLAALATSFLLMACATNEPQKVYLTKQVPLDIPTEFTEDKVIPHPSFTPEEYGSYTCERREAVLIDYNTVLIDEMGSYKRNTRKLAEWERLQKLLYSSEVEEKK